MFGNTYSRIIGMLVTMAAWIGTPGVSASFNDNAHKLLSTRAVNPALPNASILDSYLKNVLNFEFPQGINQNLVGGQDGDVQGLIRTGAVNEDKGLRPRSHFHDPTKNSWGSAGLLSFWSSSIVWSQDAGQGHSWKNARDAYFNALTALTIASRKAWYAELFRDLGHLIHLVQDAAVPAHTRNDAHLVLFGKFPDGDEFHYWADKPVGLNGINSVTQALRFDPSILNQSSPNLIAPGPIARIIDKTDGNLGTLSQGLDIGLAEYSNANFISKGTARSTFYQFPTYLQLEFPIAASPKGPPRRYARFRAGFGDQDYWVGVSSRMALFANSTVPPDSIDFGLDDNVHEGYGRKLFPRAIGYSAGLIDYFFLSQIDTAHPPLGYVLVPWEQRPSSIDVQGVKIVGNGQQTGSGTIQLVLLHENSFLGVANGPLSPGPKPLVVVSQEVPFTISSQGQTVTFPFAALPWPTEVIPALCCYGNSYMGIIVYRGTLGQETNTAVVAGGYCHDLESGDKWERFYSFENATLDGIAWAYIGEC